jgi:hypothetical protein
MKAPDLVVHSIEHYEQVAREAMLSKPGCRGLFRGQSEAWPLLPKLFRMFEGKSDHIEHCEARLMMNLRNRVRIGGVNKDGDVRSLGVNNDWDLMSIGQHYGVPTRLLDWSEDSLVALYFAVEHWSSLSPIVCFYPAGEEEVLSDDKKSKLHPFKEPHTKIFRPIAHSDRVRSQNGWHTSHAIHDRGIKGGRVIPLLSMEHWEKNVWKIRIDPRNAHEIQKQLADRGYDRPNVYGDFSQICKEACFECGVPHVP